MTDPNTLWAIELLLQLLKFHPEPPSLFETAILIMAYPSLKVLAHDAKHLAENLIPHRRAPETKNDTKGPPPT